MNHAAGYNYWANYIGHGITTAHVAVRDSCPGDRLLASDIMTMTHLHFGNHIADTYQGGHILFNDGRVEWRSAGETSRRMTLGPIGFWF